MGKRRIDVLYQPQNTSLTSKKERVDMKMEKEVYDYFAKKLKEEGIRILPGHYPKLKTKEEVDKWFHIIKQSFKDFFKEEENK